MKKLYLIIFLLLCVTQASYSQLSNFVLTLDKTDELCTGNASLSFNVSGTVPGSTIIYRIYKLPDLVNSIAVLSGNTFGGLTSGTYRVIATQTLDESSGTQQQDITIVDRRNLITYGLSNTQETCDSGTIVVTVLTGVPVAYEIISGPVTIAPQASNSFPNLFAGTYNIRVIDECGEGVVQTYTLTFPNPPNLTINVSAGSNGCQINSCDSTNLSYVVSADAPTTIRYPLTVQITIFPPANGAPIVQNLTITSGNSTRETLSATIPFYYNQSYTYAVRVVDACGNVYVSNGSLANRAISLSAQDAYSHCLNGLFVAPCNYVAPYSITFLSAPAGFNPQNFNGGHPGPFTGVSVSYMATSVANQLPLGQYSIQVTDACGRTATTTILLEEHEPLYDILLPPNACDDRFLQIPAFPSIGPLITSAVFTSATGNLGHTIPYDVSGNIVAGVLFMPIPPGTYTVQGMDECGNPYIYNIIIPPKVLNVRINVQNIVGCAVGGLGAIQVDALNGSLLASIYITQAPATFSQTLPFLASAIPPEGAVTSIIQFLPAGDYVLQITDTCGNIIFRNVTVNEIISNAPLNFYDKKGCGDNFDSIALVSPNGALITVIITAAPASFPFNLPYDVSFNIATFDHNFYMNSFPDGTYTFYSKDICNVERTSTYTIQGYQKGGTIDIISNCGAFDVNMNFTDNTFNQSTTFWLQKYDAANNRWTHPVTGIPYPNNTIPTTLNSYPINNSAINYNIVATGTFRILTIFNYYGNGSSGLALCLQTVKTFDYDGELKIISAYAIPCINGGSQVFIITNGTPPLDYKITTKDGQPFLVNNGTSNSFASLQPGIYNFRVQDVCGNIVNRLLDITTLQQPEIASSNLCPGLGGQLSVQPFSFLNYEWWKGNDTTTILSTTNTLTFNPYTAANAGVYHVRIYSTTTNSCVDRILTYTIAPNALPNAGIDGVRAICGGQSSINLFSVLNAPYDSGGTWQEITSSGMLIGNNWLPTNLPAGTYSFRYTVNGFCGVSDDAIVTITLNPPVDVPVISVNASYCPGEDLVFSIQAIPNASFLWTGPNNFSSTLQNPTIADATAANAGIYSVTATIGECNASSTVTTVSRPTPDYTYETACNSGVFEVRIIPTTQGSFDPSTATYVWTGPNNFTATTNPLILTNQPIGEYNVVVTNNDGCLSPQTISVANTLCDFPNVITPGTDGFNDSFDLTNYDVELFQVFSRWGRLVYEQNNYTNQWHGQNMHGGTLPDSTYFYFLQLRNGEEKHGWVFIGIRGN